MKLPGSPVILHKNRALTAPRNKVFVYGTLKAFKIQREALGEKYGHQEQKALLIGYQEYPFSFDHQSYPTLRQMKNGVTEGDIISVTDDELDKLDNWEENYKRILVQTNKGPAWAYVFAKRSPQPPKVA